MGINKDIKEAIEKTAAKIEFDWYEEHTHRCYNKKANPLNGNGNEQKYINEEIKKHLKSCKYSLDDKPIETYYKSLVNSYKDQDFEAKEYKMKPDIILGDDENSAVIEVKFFKQGYLVSGGEWIDNLPYLYDAKAGEENLIKPTFGEASLLETEDGIIYTNQKEGCIWQDILRLIHCSVKYKKEAYFCAFLQADAGKTERKEIVSTKEVFKSRIEKIVDLLVTHFKENKVSIAKKEYNSSKFARQVLSSNDKGYNLWECPCMNFKIEDLEVLKSDREIEYPHDSKSLVLYTIFFKVITEN